MLKQRIVIGQENELPGNHFYRVRMVKRVRARNEHGAQSPELT